ncbi:MAG: signal peptidase I, partial [Gammaproteobacteria bacterium]|nr:signal peptidase I [Gammaproteobacteria bacterium]
MSVNFPLFLVIATGLCGAIWMLDALVLRPRSKGDPQEPANWVVEYAISFF